jgi:hypothetical protein
MTLNVPDKCYSRNVSGALNFISMFLLITLIHVIYFFLLFLSKINATLNRFRL